MVFLSHLRPKTGRICVRMLSPGSQYYRSARDMAPRLYARRAKAFASFVTASSFAFASTSTVASIPPNTSGNHECRCNHGADVVLAHSSLHADWKCETGAPDPRWSTPAEWLLPRSSRLVCNDDDGCHKRREVPTHDRMAVDRRACRSCRHSQA